MIITGAERDRGVQIVWPIEQETHSLLRSGKIWSSQVEKTMGPYFSSHLKILRTRAITKLTCNSWKHSGRTQKCLYILILTWMMEIQNAVR